MAYSNLTVLFSLLVFSYIILYFRGHKYFEHFDTDSKKKNKTAPETPYLKNPIDSVDDYELSLVFQNQGSKEVSKQQISDAMTRYPIDWSVQGPDSQHFQDNQVQYEKKQDVISEKNALSNSPDSPDSLPDMTSMDEEEMKILQTYVPESSKGLLQYSIDDVKTLLEKVYTKKGLIPVIEKSKQGQNVWEVTEVKEKDPHIVWEDDTRDIMKQRGEGVIDVPYTVSDISSGLDPYFQARNGVRDRKYNEFTPGLERMFAPTYPIKEWY
jgi:hypothetical protein